MLTQTFLRRNIGNAKILGMQKDLSLSSHEYSMALTGKSIKGCTAPSHNLTHFRMLMVVGVVHSVLLSILLLRTGIQRVAQEIEAFGTLIPDREEPLNDQWKDLTHRFRSGYPASWWHGV